MTTIVCIINGYPESGKDTFCEFISEKYLSTVYSTVAVPKAIFTIMGWDGVKTPEIRDGLSTLKDLYSDLFDGPFRDLVSAIHRAIGNNVVFLFVMMREPKDIKRVVEWCRLSQIHCFTVFIQRDVQKQYNNHADAEVEHYKYDFIIPNNGTLSDFKKTALEFASNLIGSRS